MSVPEDKHAIVEDEILKEKLNDGVDRHLEVHMPEILRGLSPEEIDRLDKSVTRKLDLTMLPVVMFMFFLNFLDRNNISAAKIAGITTDLNLTATQFSTSVALLYAGLVSLQIPSNIIASKIKYPGSYICTMCLIWGLISALTSLVQSKAGLYVSRTVLGFVESAFYPGAIYMLSMFYERTKIGTRNALLYIGCLAGLAFGNLFALGIIQLDGKHGIAGWRWLYIVEGVITIGCSIFFIFIIPNRPENFRWATEAERAQLCYRLEMDRATKDATDETPVLKALQQAVTDPKTWLILIPHYCVNIVSGVSSFFTIVVGALGFNRTLTYVLSAPPYIVAMFVLYFNGLHADKKGERTWHIVTPFMVSVIANIIALSTTKTAPRYVAMVLLPSSIYSSNILDFSWISANMTGSHNKRAVVFAFVNCICNTPNIWTAYMYTKPPRYVVAFAVNLAASVVGLCMYAVYHLYLRRQNAKMDHGERMPKSGPTQVQLDAGFRYQL